MKNALFIIVNDNFFQYAIHFLNSVKKNWPNHPLVICNHYQLNNEHIDILSKYDNVQLVKINQLNDSETGIAMAGRDNKFNVSYYRLKLWSTDYDDFDNILYLDVDTLVLKPMDELINKKDFTIFSDPAPLIHRIVNDDLKKLLAEDDILSKMSNDSHLLAPMGNTGVMLFPKSIRSEDNHKNILDILHRYKTYAYWGDQSIINLWMLRCNYEHLIVNDYRFNCHSTLVDKVEFELNELCLIHFTGIKPLDKKFLTWKSIENKYVRYMLFYMFKSYEKI